MSNISTIFPAAASLSISDRVCSKIASWKASLLDLTPRNPLVALPEMGVVELPSPNDVYEPLLRRRKPLIFWDLQNKSLDRTVLRDTGNYPARAAAWNTFRHLHLQTLSLLQGQDVNALYVVFGVLSWVEPRTGQTMRSPLLLVPASLERRPDGSAYSISRSLEEDVETNPVLTHRLAQLDIGVTLPPAPEESYLIPSAYLRKVAALVEDKPGWAVEERTCLGLFPLLKMRLYEDLVAQENRAKGHPLVAALAGDQGALLRLPSVSLPSLAEMGEAGSIAEQHLLLDADPGQQQAIFAAAQGQSFVLQGPPGTGKTQTITNIISECIAANKSVLVVSSRMASLDAVLRRLSDKGLGDLCLAAHSLKTSKSDILAQLEQGLTVPPIKIGTKVTKKELDALDALRSDLNSFARELHKSRLPLGISVYQANGIIAETEGMLSSRGIKALPFHTENPELISASQIPVMEAQVALMATHPVISEAAQGNIWVSAFVGPERGDLSAQARHLLESGSRHLAQLETAAAAVASAVDIEAPDSLPLVERLLAVAEAVENTPHLELAWLSQDPVLLRETRSQIAALRDRIRELTRLQEEFTAAYDPALLTADLEELSCRLGLRYENLLLSLLGQQWQQQAISRFEPLTTVFEELGQGARALYATFESLAQRCGITLEETNEGKQRLYRIAQRAVEVQYPATGWFTPGSVPNLIRQMDEARAQWFSVRKLREDLFSVYTKQVLDLDHASILEAVNNPRSGLGRLLNTSGMRVANAIKSVTKPGVNLKDRDTARDIQSASQLKETIRGLQSREALLSAAFGSYYQGASTDWDRLRDALQKAEALSGEFAAEGGRVPPSLAALLVLGGTEVEVLNSEQASIASLLSEMRSRWETLTLQVLPGALPEPQSSLLTIASWCDTIHAALQDYQAAYRTVSAARTSTDDTNSEPPTVENLLQVLENAKNLNVESTALSLASEEFRSICGKKLFQGKDTDWGMVLQGFDSAHKLRAVTGEDDGLSEPLAELLANTDRRAALQIEINDHIANIQASKSVFARFVESLDDLFTPRYLKETLFATTPENARFRDFKEWIQERLERLDQIDRGARVQAVRDECAALGLNGFFEALSAAVAAGRADVQVPDTLQLLFRIGFYQQWVEAIASQSPSLAEFVGEEQEKNITRFRDLDRKYLDAASGRIREATRARAPKLYPDEVRVLKGQLARRRTGEVRKLLAEIPNLLFALKPCVMMNPLSVRLFLDADAVPFDVVLFDDASQIATEDAIGAILRGNQVIIAGDPKQLPPLSLVHATTASPGTETETAGGVVFESVLDAAGAVAESQPTRFARYSLNWHYRSQNESLIAFSRRYFYPSLVSFPSAQVNGGAVSYISVTDSKDEVSSESTERVLDVVLDYKKRYPSRSIGVVTLTETDYARLLDAFARRRDENPESIALLLNEEADDSETTEAFFIKMIENVQGDERDLMVLHVGSDPQHFASLWEPGSDRLLNVATTRARCDMVVVSALSPHSAAVATADSSGLAPAGIQMLNEFLQYAKDPDSLLAVARNNEPSQDTFVQTLQRALTEEGYEIRDRIGLSDYRIDLAIVDPASPDRYLLGIECDGPVYAATGTSRHRDRLCTEMLNQRGWTLHRVWSLDWNRDANKELKRIAAAVKAAKSAA